MAKKLVRAQARARDKFKAAYGPHVLEFTRGQVISDHQLALHLLNTGAPVKDESEYIDDDEEEKAQAEAARIAAEKAEAERLAAEQAEREAAEKAEAELLAAEQAEREATEKAEAERLAAEQAAANQGGADSQK